MFTPTDQWIEIFTRTVHGTLARCGVNRNSCIESTLVGRAVAQHFGFFTDPIALDVRVDSANHGTILLVPGPPGTSDRRPGFAAHLAVYFPGAELLVDLTADQFHYPSRDLHVPGPVVGRATRTELATWSGKTLRSGTTIHYRERPDDISYRTMPAWTGSSAFTIRLAVRAMYEALDQPAPV